MPAKREPTLAELNARIERLSAKRGRGRPKGSQFAIPKHMFMDERTVDELVQLARHHGWSESAVVRYLIRQAFQQAFPNAEQLNQKQER